MNLYNVNTEIQSILSTMVNPETGEVSETSLALLAELKTTVQDKCVSIASHIENLEAERNAISEAKKSMAARETRFKKQVEYLKKYLQDNMEAAEIKKISCPYFDITLRKNPPAVDVYDEKELPTKYERVIIEKDTAKIREDLMKGVIIPGARLIQRSSLQIK